MSVYAVVNPANGETGEQFPTISDADLGAAIGRADAAHSGWSRSSSVADRAALIRRVAELHTERSQALAEIIVKEMGKPIAQALGEVEFSAAIYAFYADNAEKLLADEPIELLDGDGTARGAPAAPSASCSASCPGTSPTTRWPASPDRTW